MEKTLIERAQALTAGITKPFRSPFMPLWPTPTPPIEVVVDLARAGRGDETIAAALVRGAVYAKSLSVEEVRDALGEQVASIVAECNDPGGPDAWTSHETRMRHLAETLRSGSAAAHAILCVEATHTLRRVAAVMEQHGVDVWRGQPGGYEGQRSLYRTLLEAAWGRPARRRAERPPSRRRAPAATCRQAGATPWGRACPGREGRWCGLESVFAVHGAGVGD